MTTRQLPYGAAYGETARARRLAAVALRCAGLLLARMARRLRRAEPMPAGDPVLEFYAEAGAAEGALYVDGQLVATLPGVMRL